jgi:hypothetical protein
MAIINASFDTKTKSIEVSMDGAAVANVWGVNFSKSYDDDEKYHCEIMTLAKDKDNGTMSYTRLMANEIGVPAGAKYLTEAPEFIVSTSDKPVFVDINLDTTKLSEQIQAELASYYNEKV